VRSTSSAAAGTQGAKKADQAFSAALAGSAGGIGLRDATGKLADSVGYGTATNALVETRPAARAAGDTRPGGRVTSASRTPAS
jgi:hypothetical protein